MLFAKRKRVIVAIIALVGFVCVFSACSNNQMPQKLSELEETILLQRLTDHGISIPANLEISVICDAIADLELIRTDLRQLLVGQSLQIFTKN